MLLKVLHAMQLSLMCLTSELTKFGVYHQYSHLTIWDSINDYLFFYSFVLHVNK